MDADVYVADDIAQRRGKGSSLEAEIASGYINVPVITRDIAFWEEKEVDLGNKYRMHLSSILTSLYQTTNLLFTRTLKWNIVEFRS